LYNIHSICSCFDLHNYVRSNVSAEHEPIRGVRLSSI